ncbi:MAG: 50S ribosomal protein L27 [Candidatus Parcubacteria bacterium]|nr:50S ribosomal protein L27 [Candidatus Parcubacteria bacterium]
MSHKKAGGSTSLGRDSQGQRLGIKIQDGQTIKTGMIIVRQRGTKFRPGKNVRRAKDDTLYAGAPGVVKFLTRKLVRFNGALRKAKIVNIIPAKTK